MRRPRNHIPVAELARLRFHCTTHGYLSKSSNTQHRVEETRLFGLYLYTNAQFSKSGIPCLVVIMESSSRVTRPEPQQYPPPVYGSWDDYTTVMIRPDGRVCLVCMTILILIGVPWSCRWCQEGFVDRSYDLPVALDSFQALASLKACKIPENYEYELGISGLIRTSSYFCYKCFDKAFGDHPVTEYLRNTGLFFIPYAVKLISVCAHCRMRVGYIVRNRALVFRHLVLLVAGSIRYSGASNLPGTEPARRRTTLGDSLRLLITGYLRKFGGIALIYEDHTLATAFSPITQNSLVISQENLRERELLLQERERALEERERVVAEREQALQHQLQLQQGSSQRPVDVWLDCITVDSPVYSRWSTEKSSESGGVPLMQMDERLMASPSRGITPSRTDISMDRFRTSNIPLTEAMVNYPAWSESPYFFGNQQ